VEARLLNDAPAEVQGTVRWTFDGRQVADADAGGSMSVTAPPFESVAAGEVSVPADATALELSLETGTTAVVNRYRL
jgi:hypothetical protein